MNKNVKTESKTDSFSYLKKILHVNLFFAHFQKHNSSVKYKT